MDEHALPNPLADQFLRELLETGLSLSTAMASLLEALDEGDPWPGEEPGEVLLRMGAGSVAIALRGAADAEVMRAIELIAAARERFLADLRLAATISGRRESMRR